MIRALAPGPSCRAATTDKDLGRARLFSLPLSQRNPWTLRRSVREMTSLPSSRSADDDKTQAERLQPSSALEDSLGRLRLCQNGDLARNPNVASLLSLVKCAPEVALFEIGRILVGRPEGMSR